MERVARISVIVPMLDEAEHVEQLVADVAAQDFPGEVELLVADGGSTDGSVDRLTQAADRHDVQLSLIANPNRWVSHGLNACIRHATGDLVVRLDCHARYPADYLRLLAQAAEETGAWNVGGVVVPSGRTPMERAVACAMDGPFGGIGWSRLAVRGARVEVDTVTYGAFRPVAFEQAGLYDESLVRNQDDELNLRLRRAGGRIVLDPSVSVRYTPRGSWRKTFRQYYQYGFWKVPVMLKHEAVLGARSLAPLALVGSLALLVPAATLSRRAREALALEAGAYALVATVFGTEAVRRRGEPWRRLPRVMTVYPAFHLGYGLGMGVGWLRALRRPRPSGRPV